ncbi:MAG: alpha/beta hydrolase, partial [Pseudomonadota bacterium]
MTARFTTSDGLSLAYEDAGAGLPVLCLPGLTRNARDFDDLAAVLPAGLRLIRLTFRGREPSEFAPDPALYQIPVEARDTVELLDHLGLEKVVIVGTSRGGLVAMTLAATYKDRLAGVLLSDIGPEIAPEGMARIYEYIGVAPKGADLDAVAAALMASLAAQFPTIALERWRILAERWFKMEEGRPALRYDPRLAEPVLAGRGQDLPDLWPLFDLLEGV